MRVDHELLYETKTRKYVIISKAKGMSIRTDLTKVLNIVKKEAREKIEKEYHIRSFNRAIGQ